MWLVALGALAIGASLGLLGSGGSILTVPALVYLAHEERKVAIASSLAIVGAISAAAAVPYARAKLVDGRMVLAFGVPGVAGTYAGAWLAKFVPASAQIGLLAAVMLAAAILLVRAPRAASERIGARAPDWVIGLEGIGVGLLTGLVGVGGGFLIVPALVLLGGLDMRRAVATSLVIIAIKSLAGFAKYLDVLGELGLAVDWNVVALFSAAGIAGSLLAARFARKVPQLGLQRTFAAVLVVVAAGLAWGEWR